MDVLPTQTIASRPVAKPAAPSRALLAASLVLLAFNLRPAFASLGPILPELIRETGLSTVDASLLTTLPVLCLGLFAPFAPALARKFGTERTIFIFLTVTTLGIAARGLPGKLTLFGGSVLLGLGVGIINVLLPALVKRHFPDRTALMMGVYSMMLCAGASLAAGVTVPLERAFGDSATGALAFWTLPALAAALLWLTQVPRHMPSAISGGFVVRGLWRDPLAWQLTLFMALQSAVFYAGLGWLAPILRDRGLDPVGAGLVTSVSIVVQIGSSLVAPVLATRGRDQRASVMASMVSIAVGMFGCLFAPLSTVWVWSVILGLGQGAAFALALTMILLRARDAPVAAKLSSMVQGVGYTVASGGALLTGLIYGWSHGSIAAVGLLFAALILAGMVSGWGAGRALLVNVTAVAKDP